MSVRNHHSSEHGLYFTGILLGIGLSESSCQKNAQLRCWQSKRWCVLSQPYINHDNQPDAMCVLLLLHD